MLAPSRPRATWPTLPHRRWHRGHSSRARFRHSKRRRRREHRAATMRAVTREDCSSSISRQLLLRLHWLPRPQPPLPPPRRNRHYHSRRRQRCNGARQPDPLLCLPPSPHCFAARCLHVNPPPFCHSGSSSHSRQPMYMHTSFSPLSPFRARTLVRTLFSVVNIR